ncbi:hypothetical protein Ndes2526B_g06394 [Nannochloris sp. 'desiccata']|nr:hypothetical protein NADE_006262 [Chlorella desiccata (nom. nud.)]
MFGTELLKCSSEQIEEYLSEEVHPVSTQVYTGPDAQMPDESTFEACGRDVRRCQAVCIRNAIKTLKEESTLPTYVDCLKSGWMAAIDARNKEPEHTNDQWDNVSHPMSKVSTILCGYIVPKLIANPASKDLVGRFDTHLSAIDTLQRAQYGLLYSKMSFTITSSLE